MAVLLALLLLSTIAQCQDYNSSLITLEHDTTEFELDPEELLTTSMVICNTSAYIIQPPPRVTICSENCTNHTRIDHNFNHTLNYSQTKSEGYSVDQYLTNSTIDNTPCHQFILSFYNNRSLNLNSIHLDVYITDAGDRSNQIPTNFNVTFREEKRKDCTTSTTPSPSPSSSPTPSPNPIPCTDSAGAVQQSTAVGIAVGSAVFGAVIGILLTACIAIAVGRRNNKQALPREEEEEVDSGYTTGTGGRQATVTGAGGGQATGTENGQVLDEHELHPVAEAQRSDGDQWSPFPKPARQQNIRLPTDSVSHEVLSDSV